MPTTTEVEARLRRTAAACEPLVEDLLGEPPAPVPARHRPPARPWLLAAAVALVVALAGFAVVVAQDGPADDVQADGGGPSTSPTPTTEATSGPSGSLPVLLPDGTRVALGVPDPDRWTPGDSLITADVDGLDGPVTVALTPRTLDDIRERSLDATTVERVGPDVSLLDDGPMRYVVVERDGWSALVLVAAEGASDSPMPEEVVTALVEGLSFTVTADGPTGVTGPGLEVTQELRWVDAAVPEGAEPSQLQLSVDDDRAHCTAGPPEVVEVATCIDGVRVVAWGEQAEAAFPDVAVTILDDPPTGTEPSPPTSPVPTAPR